MLKFWKALWGARERFEGRQPSPGAGGAQITYGESTPAYYLASSYPPNWAALRYPWQRHELILCLKELTAPDPRQVWKEERAKGLLSDIDQVIHFFFDDHDFDVSEVGYNLFDEREVALVQKVKLALDLIIQALPDGDDDDYVEHPRWREVTEAATNAHRALANR